MAMRTIACTDERGWALVPEDHSSLVESGTGAWRGHLPRYLASSSIE
jgi:hypothetical protein